MDAEFVKIDYTPPNNQDVEGVLKVTLLREIDQFVSPERLPFRLEHMSNSGKVLWNFDLMPGTWSAYSFLSYTTMKVTDNLGNKIAEWKWDTFLHGDAVHQAFYLWAMENRGAKGIAIGTHNGATGEWVGPVMDGLLHGVLVEPSDMQYQELSNLYSRKTNVVLEKKIVTPKHGNVKFYEHGEGFTNSVKKEHVQSWHPGSEPVEKDYECIEINDLFREHFENGEPTWVHMDVEGIDQMLLMSMRCKPTVIIYEHENMENEMKKLRTILRDTGYTLFDGGRNTMALRS